MTGDTYTFRYRGRSFYVLTFVKDLGSNRLKPHYMVFPDDHLLFDRVRRNGWSPCKTKALTYTFRLCYGDQRLCIQGNDLIPNAFEVVLYYLTRHATEQDVRNWCDRYRDTLPPNKYDLRTAFAETVIDKNNAFEAVAARCAKQMDESRINQNMDVE